MRPYLTIGVFRCHEQVVGYLPKAWASLTGLVGFEHIVHPHRTRRLPVNLQNYLRITAAATFLGVSVNTLRNWERTGKIVTFRHPVNGYRLYRKADLEALLAGVARSDRPKESEP